MMAKILKGLGTDIEIDATSDFTFILGDLNYRFLSTYTAHIKQVKDSHKLISQLDEYYYEFNEKKRYPDYQEHII